eukprot:16234-Heterococcus_DN1.PRE.1
MYSHAQDKRAAKGGVLTAEEETAMKAPLLARLDTENSAYYSTARLWDDGVIDPKDTSGVVLRSLALLDPVTAALPALLLCLHAVVRHGASSSRSPRAQ